jgi:dihydrofolate reductase
LAKLPRIRMPSISFVVARSEPGHVIGCDNRLPWKLKSDLINFKSITINHVIIMGKKTFDSIGKPLPNRITVVVSSRQQEKIQNVYFARNSETALYISDYISILNGYSEIFIVGGGMVYEIFPFNKIYLTEVYAPDVLGDTYFRQEFDMRSWTLESMKRFEKSEYDEYPFVIKVLRKKDKTTYEYRYRSLAKFLTVDDNLKDWEANQMSGMRLPNGKIKSKIV